MARSYHRPVQEIVQSLVKKYPLDEMDATLLVHVAANFAMPRAQRKTIKQLAQELGTTEYRISRLRRMPEFNELRARFIMAQVEDAVPDVLITHAKKAAAGSVSSADFFWKSRKDLRKEVGLEKEETQNDPLAAQRAQVEEELILRIEAVRKRVLQQSPVIKRPAQVKNVEHDNNDPKARVEAIKQQLSEGSGDSTA